MSHLPLQLPASLRSASSTSWNDRSARNSVRPYLVTGAPKQTVNLNSKPFIKLPKEDDDAKITGTTRSLDRRLLALNVCGSLRATVRSSMSLIVAETQIA